MKYFLVLFAAIIFMSCISKNAQENKADTSIANLIKTEKVVLIENKIFDEAIDFTTYLPKNLIGDNIYQVDVKSSITFKNCVFNETVTAYHSTDEATILTAFYSNVTFIGCKFNNDVSLRAATIAGRLDLSKSKFFGKSSFEEMSCAQSAYFNDCYFDKEVGLQNSYFAQKVNFLNAQFNETVSFQSTVFNGEAQFSVCKFYGYTDFSLVDCRGNVFFNYAQFHERADLSNANFARDVNYSSTLNKMTTFENSRFLGKTTFIKSEVSESLNLEKCFFLLGQPNLDFIKSEKLKL
ncbi:MAG: pentapeptide repeat-containing protein [Chitinophagales bacterium]